MVIDFKKIAKKLGMKDNIFSEAPSSRRRPEVYLIDSSGEKTDFAATIKVEQTPKGYKIVDIIPNKIKHGK